MRLQLETIPREGPRYPAPLRERLARNAPPQVTALDAGRRLLLSAFPETETRITADLARRRNELAALADEAIIIQATPGGHVAQLSEQFQQWGIRVVRVVGG